MDCGLSQHHRLKLKKEGHCNTFGSSLNITLRRNVGTFLGFCWDKSMCEWRGLAQSFIHSRTRSHGVGSLMHWSPHLLHWGLVNLKSLWRIHHLSACSGKRHITEKCIFTLQPKACQTIVSMSIMYYLSWSTFRLLSDPPTVLQLWAAFNPKLRPKSNIET